MAWYYTKDGMDIGPIEDQVMMALVRDGVITSATLVWRDDWKTWQPASQTELSPFFPTQYHTPYQGMQVVRVTEARANIVDEPRSNIHSKSPPKEWAILGLFFPGIPQMIFGQVGKGLIIFVSCYILLFIPVFGWAAIIAFMVDGFKVGEAVERGDEIGPMEFFPKPRR